MCSWWNGHVPAVYGTRDWEICTSRTIAAEQCYNYHIFQVPPSYLHVYFHELQDVPMRCVGPQNGCGKCATHHSLPFSIMWFCWNAIELCLLHKGQLCCASSGLNPLMCGFIKFYILPKLNFKNGAVLIIGYIAPGIYKSLWSLT